MLLGNKCTTNLINLKILSQSRQMEEAALQDYRDKDVHSSRDFTAKVGGISCPHFFSFL